MSYHSTHPIITNDTQVDLPFSLPSLAPAGPYTLRVTITQQPTMLLCTVVDLALQTA